jgi:uncharacterized protein (DUF1697 family)
MGVHVALLRGINVGGRKMVAMSDLCDCLAAAGFGAPQTLLQSGNVVFESARLTGEPLERRLEAECRKRLGLETDFFVRSENEWHAVVADNPFAPEAKADPGHLVVQFLRASPPRQTIAALQAALIGPERVRVAGRLAYIVYPDGMGRSRLTPAILEKHLGRGTARNWNTILRVKDVLGTRD